MILRCLRTKKEVAVLLSQLIKEYSVQDLINRVAKESDNVAH